MRTELQLTQLKLDAWHSAQLATWHPGTIRPVANRHSCQHACRLAATSTLLSTEVNGTLPNSAMCGPCDVEGAASCSTRHAASGSAAGVCMIPAAGSHAQLVFPTPQSRDLQQVNADKMCMASCSAEAAVVCRVRNSSAVLFGSGAGFRCLPKGSQIPFRYASDAGLPACKVLMHVDLAYTSRGATRLCRPVYYAT